MIMKYLKYNKTEFRPGICKNISFTQFKLWYSELLKGQDLEKVFIELGGEVKKKPFKKAKKEIKEK